MFNYLDFFFFYNVAVQFIPASFWFILLMEHLFQGNSTTAYWQLLFPVISMRIRFVISRKQYVMQSWNKVFLVYFPIYCKYNSAGEILPSKLLNTTKQILRTIAECPTAVSVNMKINWSSTGLNNHFQLLCKCSPRGPTEQTAQYRSPPSPWGSLWS